MIYKGFLTASLKSGTGGRRRATVFSCHSKPRHWTKSRQKGFLVRKFKNRFARTSMSSVSHNFIHDFPKRYLKVFIEAHTSDWKEIMKCILKNSIQPHQGLLNEARTLHWLENTRVRYVQKRKTISSSQSLSCKPVVPNLFSVVDPFDDLAESYGPP